MTSSCEDIFSSNFENIFMNHDDIFENDCIFFSKTFSELGQHLSDHVKIP